MGMKKQWTGREKLALVLEGLKGECRISELCNEHGISQGMYYKWRDQLLTDGAKLFERGGVDHARERLERENRKLADPLCQFFRIQILNRCVDHDFFRSAVMFCHVPVEIQKTDHLFPHGCANSRRIPQYTEQGTPGIGILLRKIFQRDSFHPPIPAFVCFLSFNYIGIRKKNKGGYSMFSDTKIPKLPVSESPCPDFGFSVFSSLFSRFSPRRGLTFQAVCGIIKKQ